MIKRIHIYICFLSLLIFKPAFGQPEVLSDLENKFNRYVKAIPREEIFMHTDRDEYIAGEEMFFKLYIIDRQSYKISKWSKIAYVELLNDQQSPVIQQKILALTGSGSGIFSLPDTLQPGAYTVRAYTSWMKNFLPANCFKKTIVIYNFLQVKENVPKISLQEINKPLKNSHIQKAITLTIDKSLRDSLRIGAEINSDTVEGPFNLIVQSHGNIEYAGTCFPMNNTIRMSIPVSTLKPGMHQVTVFNGKGQPLDEKLTYTPVPVKNTTTIEIKKKYNTREKIDMTVKSSEPGTISISVAPGAVHRTGIEDYMVFGTEFGLNAFQIAGGKRDDIGEKQIDSLLSGVTSNWIDWKLIGSGKLTGTIYPAESEYHFINGIMSGSTDSSRLILLNSPGKQAVFQYARCDKAGRFTIPVILDSRLQDYIVMPADSQKGISITIESPFADLPELHNGPQSEMRIPDYIADWNINYQVRRLYNISGLIDSNIISKLPEKKVFYGKPDYELVMADYISLPTMEEVFYEILPHVSIRKGQAGKEIVIIDRIENRPYMAIPCLMIDGVIINDPDLIIDMDPRLVEKIDVFRSKYIVGSYMFAGIVNVITLKSDLSSIPFPRYMTRITFGVKGSGKVFNSPDHSGNDHWHNPDFRTTLYWNPLVTAGFQRNYNISFYASDIAASYPIMINGVHDDGTFFSESANVNVERSPGLNR